MTSFRRWSLMVLLVSLALSAACAAPVAQAPVQQATQVPTDPPAEPPTATSAPPTATPAPPTPTSPPPTATSSGGSQPAKLDLNALFPPGEGRELVLSSCESCHSWVCAVRGQRSREHWGTVKTSHEPLVPSLSQEEIDQLFEYLAANFNDTQPEPELPYPFNMLGCTAQ